MGKASRARRSRSAEAGESAIAPVEPGNGRSWIWLGLCWFAVVAAASWLRVAAPTPRSYDEYYHLALARMVADGGFPDSFPWTPMSIFAERFVDKEPLFHLLEVPFSGGSIESAGLAVNLVCLVSFFLVAAVFLRRATPANAVVLLPMLVALGSLFAFRLAMARPHQLLLLLSSLLLLLLTTSRDPERPRVLAALAAISAAAGLGHTAGWIGIGLATFWGLCGPLTPASGAVDRSVRWKPAAAIALGWLAGQFLHPNFPANFRLHWLQGFVIPFQASGSGSADLAAVIGQELTPLAPDVLVRQATAFVPIGLAVFYLLKWPRARTRSTLTLAIASLGFLAVSAWRFQRLFELGAPLGVFALGLALGAAQVRWTRRQNLVAGALILAGIIVSQHGLILATEAVSPPRRMAEWLGEHGRDGERVFTAQWADSAPLLFSAPQLTSMVTLDPTFFWLRDAELFSLYVRTAFGQTSDPARVLRERFGVRWVTISKRPAYQGLARQLAASGVAEASRSYEDDAYQVWDLRPGT